MLAGAAIVMVPGLPAFAQEVPASAPVSSVEAQDEKGESEKGEIVVTGSLVTRNGFNAPTPVTVIGQDTLERVAAPNIADVINQMPAVRPSLTPTSTVNLSSVAAGNFLDLRGLGFQRTQVLVNGRRYVPTTAAGGLSISSIPQALINRVDIVTGGASAAYGSDAVAGVVNLIIDSEYEGLKGVLQGGMADEGDYRNFLTSLAYGASLAGDRLHVVVAAEAAQNGGIDTLRSRAWSARNPGTIANPAFTATNAEPRLLLVTGDIRQSNVSYGGVINSPNILRGIQFRPDGSAAPFTFGTLVSATQMLGGDGANGVADGVAAVPTERYTGFGRITYDLSDYWNIFSEVSYNKLKSRFLGLASANQLTIRTDNVFLPASVRTTAAANNIASITVGRSVLDNGRPVPNIDIDTIAAIGGFHGEFGADWNIDAYYSYGRTANRNTTSNNRITANFNLALDAIDDPRTVGVVDPICRSTISNPNNGCVPLNLIGENRFSQAAINYVNGTGFTFTDIRQHIVAATLRGAPLSTWAGPVSAALGGEYRSLSLAVTADPISAAQAFANGGTIPFSGKVTVKEVFGEVLIPLAKDATWAKNLSIDLAGRLTDYSTSGQVTTWKAGVDYSINDSIRLRFTRSRDIRAPSLSELFSLGSTTTLIVDDPMVGASYLVTAANQGNPGLNPEVADTLTGGVVFTPSFAPRFSLSVDYYDIQLNQAIISLTPATIVTRCFTTSPQACSLITRGADGRITRVVNGPVNLTSVKTSGVDVELQYSLPIGSDRINFQTLVTYLINTTIFDGITTTRLGNSVEQPTVAAVGGNPNWKVNSNVSYVASGFRVSAAARYVGGGNINNAFTRKDINILSVKGRVYFDLSASVDIIKRGEERIALFGTIQNLLDTDPPITGVGGFGTTRALYDTIGRVFTAGVRFNF